MLVGPVRVVVVHVGGPLELYAVVKSFVACVMPTWPMLTWSV
jgi:hypothetical protein